MYRSAIDRGGQWRRDRTVTPPLPPGVSIPARCKRAAAGRQADGADWCGHRLEN